MAITICNSVEPNVGLIIGPPGTGKTNVICNIILSLMSNKLTKTKTKPKLLICAPSNEAADVIVRRIIEIKKDLKRKFLFILFHRI
jgi:superfamily I DNA and/or RNA helicase